MRQIPFRVSDDLYDRIEEARGDTPRERWLRTVVIEYLASGDVEAEEPKRLLTPRLGPLRERNTAGWARQAALNKPKGL